MTIVAHAHPFVIGVDTHARNHVLAVVTPTGQKIDSAQFPTTPAGMARAITWAGARTGGDLEALWVIEGIGSYGAQLATTVQTRGYPVAEAPQMDARAHRARGKSDVLDAHRIAAAALPLATDQLRHPRLSEGVRAALRVLITARDLMTTQRTATLNALTALLRLVDLGIDARRPLTNAQVMIVARWRPRTEDLATATARTEAIRLAKQAHDLTDQITTNAAGINDLVRASHGAPLLDKPGIGPITAAIALTAWSHHGRVRSEAAFAALAGTNPIPASSGNTTRHRLNRGGDRRLNRALHTTALNRMIHDPQTRAYVEKRRAQGLTTKEIRRCIKRYLARQIYRTLNATPNPLDET